MGVHGRKPAILTLALFVTHAVGVGALAQRQEVTVPVVSFALKAVQGVKTAERLDLPDSRRLGEPGEPDIPWRVMTVLLPPSAAPETVAVRLEGARWEAIQGLSSVEPVPPVATWDGQQQVLAWPSEKKIVNGRDMTIYAKDALWPEVEIRLLSAGRLRKWRLAEVAVPLLRYNPAQGIVLRMAAGNVVVSFNPAGAPAQQAASIQAELSDSIGEDAVRRIAVNYDQQQADYQASPSAESSEGPVPPSGGPRPGYVIITTSAIQSASTRMADFVAHKKLCGFDVRVITEADFGGGVGDPAAENIRAWLAAHYVTDRIQYVLLVGYPDPTYGDIPMKMLWPRYNQAEDREAPSDYYYADLTGNWDLDHDGFYGEWSGDFGPGGVDRNWEVLVGRIPYYGNVTDVDTVLQKTIDYEVQPSDQRAWRKNVLLPMKPSDDSTPGYHLGEQIKSDTLIPNGWAYHRIYEQTYGLVPPPETTPCTNPNVRGVWSSGAFGLVVWWTHGSAISASSVLSIFDVPYLNNIHPVFTFQVSCTNAYPEGVNLCYALLLNGAACTVGATRVSWYYVGQTRFNGSPSNSGMGYEYASRVVARGLTSGQALHELKQVLSPPSSAMWMNFAVFNIYGDPSLCIMPSRHNLTLGISNSMLGEVYLEPEPNDANQPAYAYAPGTVVTLTAVPDEGKSFDQWTLYDPNHPGDANYAAADTNLTTTVVMGTDREVTAKFRCGTGAAPMLPAMVILLTAGLLRMARRKS
jgi:hypothetical protein